MVERRNARKMVPNDVEVAVRALGRGHQGTIGQHYFGLDDVDRAVAELLGEGACADGEVTGRVSQGTAPQKKVAPERGMY